LSAGGRVGSLGAWCSTGVEEEMSGTVAARAGRWSAGYSKTATVAWLAFVVSAVASGSAAGTTMPTDAENASGASAKAQRILAAGYDNSAEAVLVQARSHSLRPGPAAAARRPVDGGRARLAPNLLFRVYERSDLSMDYHVFILSRIKELVDRGPPSQPAVERGIRATAGTVTSAAFVIVAMCSTFATLSTLDLERLGFGLAPAVLLDATVVRAVPLRAKAKLLGRSNWYLPRSLHQLPRLHHDAAVPPAAETA
jgi:hypothetical protein